MVLHPPPTIELDLVLVQQPLTLTGVGHRALITYALLNQAAYSAQTLANACQSTFNTAWQSQFDTGCTIEAPSIILGQGTAIGDFAIASGATVAGTNSIDSPPPQVAVLVRKVTGQTGRANRGRNYYPWIMGRTTIGEDGSLSGGDVTAFQTAADAMHSAFAGASIPMAISNKTLAIDPDTGKTYVTAITSGPPVTLYKVEDKVATQRRRLVRQ